MHARAAGHRPARFGNISNPRWRCLGASEGRFTVAAGLRQDPAIPPRSAPAPPAAGAAQRDRRDQKQPLEKELHVGRHPYEGEPIEAGGHGDAADDGPEDMELSFAQHGRSDEGRREGGERKAVAAIGLSASDRRGEEHAGYRRAQTRYDESEA